MVRSFRWMIALPVFGLLLAQQPAKEPSTAPPFKSSTTEVLVPVTVTNDKGYFVSNLDKNDFEIFDEGKPQTINYFSREPNQPVVVGFLLDLSNSSKINWKDYQESAVNLVFALQENNKNFAGYLIGYHNEAELRVDTTADPELIANEIRTLKPSGGAALYDAIYMACTSRKLIKGEPVDPRRVVVIIGDGNDNASKYTLDQVVELAQKNQVTIYAVSTDRYGSVGEYRKTLDRLAADTGGKVEAPLMNVYNNVSGFLSQSKDGQNYQLSLGAGQYTSKIAGAIVNSVTNLVGEITTQYILRYQLTAPDDGKDKRNVTVKVNLPGVTVRAREYYYRASQ